MRRLLPLAGAVVMLLFAAVSARADDQADAKAIIEKAIKARGGGDNIDKVQAGTVSMKGKVYRDGNEIDYTGSVTFQRPDKQRLEVNFEIGNMKFTFLQVFNKDKGWIALNDTVNALDKDAVAEALETIHANGLEELRPSAFKGVTLATLGEVKVEGKPAVGVRVEAKGKRDVSLFFDKETHRLIKSERRAKDVQSGGEEFNEEKYYGDYKDAGGVKVPHKLTIKRDGKVYIESEVTDYKTAEKIDDSQFAKP
jgi:outer membrane lipoprotein-sorting protein